MAAYQSYASKLYEPNVQEVIESTRSVFEPDADTVTEALENLTNNQGNIIYSRGGGYSKNLWVWMCR